MFFPVLTVLALSIITSVVGTPWEALIFADVARPEPHPKTTLKFRAHVVVDLANFRQIKIPEGTRINAGVLGGNWTSPDGTLLATVVPGVGGEHGYIDSTGVFHLDVRYTVQFVADKKWAYYQAKGFGTAGVINRIFPTIESDSVAAKGLVEQTLYAPGVFVGNVLVASHWALN